MRLLIFALCVASAAAVIGKRCESADDCDEEECCVNFILTSAFGGLCRPLRKEGQICSPILKDNNEVPNMYHFVCPCTEGLDCYAKREIRLGDHIVKLKPRCKKPEDISEPEDPDPQEPEPEEPEE